MSGTQFPPSGPTSIARIIPSYLYKQFEDDDDLQTFVAAQNIMAQWWLDWFATTNLAYYPSLTGDLLDWVAAGLYGIYRPLLTFAQSSNFSGYATAPYDVVAYNAPLAISSSSYVTVNDDIFHRIMTWHFYKGDGFQFTAPWLKKRIHRFLNGVDGILPVNDNTQDVSLAYSGTTITATLATSAVSQIFSYCVQDGVLALPFQYTLNVVLT